MPKPASAMPSAPPPSASTALSVRHWRTSRQRPAPSATRMASSRSRETARASIRLATLAHAISSTRRDGAQQQPQRGPHVAHIAAVAAVRASCARCCCPGYCSASAAADGGHFRLRLRQSRAGPQARPSPCTGCASRFRRYGAVFCPSGVYTSPSPSSCKPRRRDAHDGLRRCPSSTSVAPITSRRLRKWRCHKL